MDESLQGLLAQLKEEIEEAERGETDHAELRRLLDAVERRLDPDREDDDDSVLEELEEGVVRWESSHPRLAGTIRQLADTLSGMGL